MHHIITIVLVVAGVLIGIAGGAVGSYFAIKNTASLKEKKFMIKCSVVAWIISIIFITMLLLIPQPHNYLIWIPYSIFLPFGIIYINKKQEAIRNSNK